MIGSESEIGVEGAAEQTEQSLKAAVADLRLRLPEFDEIHRGLPESLLVIQWYSICCRFQHNFTGFSICLDVAIMFVKLEIVLV